MKDQQTKAVRMARDEPFLSKRRVRAYVVCALIASGLSLGGLPPGGSKAMAGSISDLTPHEAQLFNLTNQARAANGLVQLRVAAGATDVARNWTRYMANSGSFRHNPHYAAELIAFGQSNATLFSENIAYGYSTADAMFNGYMASPDHRANILAPAMRFVGIGSVRDTAGRVYNTMNFVNAEDGSRPRTLSAGDYFGGLPDIILSTAVSGNSVGSQFDAPWATGTPVVCDWNGDGVDSVAFFNQGWWSIPESNSPEARVWTFAYGNPTDQPLCGDWNRDGIDTLGVYRNGWAFLRDANNTENPSVSFAYGNPGDVAVAGDFNGDGWDSVGVRRGNTFYLSNSHFRPVAEIIVTYGLASDRPLMADINGDGVDTIAVHRNNTFFFSSSNTTPDALIIASFGNPTDVPFVGNFSGDRRDEKGLYRR